MGGYYVTNSLVLLYNRDKGICHICGLFVPIQEATRDHVIPRRKAIELGKNYNNIKLAHKICNNNKADLDLEVVYAAARLTEDKAILHTHSKTQGLVGDEEFERAIKTEKTMAEAVVNRDADETVLGSTNKHWRCGSCGSKNVSEEVTLKMGTHIKKVRYCWHCETENVMKVELKPKPNVTPGKWTKDKYIMKAESTHPKKEDKGV